MKTRKFVMTCLAAALLPLSIFSCKQNTVAETDEAVKEAMSKLSKVSDPIFTKFYQENPEAAAEAARQAGFDPNNMGGNGGAGYAGGDGVVNDGDNMTPPEGGWED